MTEDTLGKIGKYELVEMIGEGAMGKVYRALDPVLGRHVAIKLMSASIANDAHLRDRFLREARAAANLQHPNIITIYDFGETDGHPFIAMEFVEGTDLAHLIEQREPLSLDSKVSLLIGLLNGLAYAHTKGVVHRDIKPANIRVTPDGRVKIMDFGIAHLSGSEITHSGAVLGTPDYMAPEQVRGLPVTAATDIFAAGAVLYELLTYEKPFTGETLHAVLFKVVTENPRRIRDINPSLPENLQRIVDTALSKEPGQRYPTADAMAADLSSARAALTDLETVATLRFTKPLNLGLPPLEWWKRRPAQYAGTALATVIVLMAAWTAVDYARRETAPANATSNSAGASPVTAVPASTAGAGPAVAISNPQTDSVSTASQGTSTVTPAPPVTAARADAKPAGTRPKPASRKPATPPPAKSEERIEVEREILRLEHAISSAQTSEIKLVMPGLQDTKGWDDFFKNKKEFRANFTINDLEIAGSKATAQIAAVYAFVDAKSGDHRHIPLRYTAVLEKSPGGSNWIWKDLK